VCVCDGVDLLSVHCGSQSGHCGGAGGGRGPGAIVAPLGVYCAALLWPVYCGASLTFC
jgi:hypothetical protein